MAGSNYSSNSTVAVDNQIYLNAGIMAFLNQFEQELVDGNKKEAKGCYFFIPDNVLQAMQDAVDGTTSGGGTVDTAALEALITAQTAADATNCAKLETAINGISAGSGSDLTTVEANLATLIADIGSLLTEATDQGLSIDAVAANTDAVEALLGTGNTLQSTNHTALIAAIAGLQTSLTALEANTDGIEAGLADILAQLEAMFDEELTHGYVATDGSPAILITRTSQLDGSRTTTVVAPDDLATAIGTIADFGTELILENRVARIDSDAPALNAVAGPEGVGMALGREFTISGEYWSHAFADLPGQGSVNGAVLLVNGLPYTLGQDPTRGLSPEAGVRQDTEITFAFAAGSDRGVAEINYRVFKGVK